MRARSPAVRRAGGSVTVQRCGTHIWMIGAAAVARSCRGAGTAWRKTRYGLSPRYGMGRARPTSQSPDRVMVACQPSRVSWRVRSSGSRATLMSRWRVPSRRRRSTISPDLTPPRRSPGRRSRAGRRQTAQRAGQQRPEPAGRRRNRPPAARSHGTRSLGPDTLAISRPDLHGESQVGREAVRKLRLDATAADRRSPTGCCHGRADGSRSDAGALSALDLRTRGRDLLPPIHRSFCRSGRRSGSPRVDQACTRCALAAERPPGALGNSDNYAATTG